MTSTRRQIGSYNDEAAGWEPAVSFAGGLAGVVREGVR